MAKRLYETEELEEEDVREPWNGHDPYANFGENEYRKRETLARIRNPQKLSVSLSQIP
ncbi:hypothetical protein [Haloquadratum walsbyi]|uniref:Uncharacterized protein n=1 Tax=Haloquadratum walsbyi J07HQW2 TaxID=1238425 RepID=U1MV93_9EURY|nr:hypothetical protein [Haloquadratum walsbyi]ERG94334.1 MAG: hypothetical protein J07HQW2_00768 [Haloquadratum walsbyi J07HQW2]